MRAITKARVITITKVTPMITLDVSFIFFFFCCLFFVVMFFLGPSLGQCGGGKCDIGKGESERRGEILAGKWRL
jgi:hypothetical protein